MEVNFIMFREDGSKRVFPITAGATTIGRKQDCDIRIPLASISRRHAEIFVGKGGATIRDLGAANGTFLNNKRIEKQDLAAGDQILIGPVVFTVQIDGSPTDAELVEVRTKVTSAQRSARGPSGVTTSEHVRSSNEEIDPISALEAWASSADQTAIHTEEDGQDSP